MKEATNEKFTPPDMSLDECCNIAESMMQEIQIIRLMRQIEQAKQMSMIG